MAYVPPGGPPPSHASPFPALPTIYAAEWRALEPPEPPAETRPCGRLRCAGGKAGRSAKRGRIPSTLKKAPDAPPLWEVRRGFRMSMSSSGQTGRGAHGREPARAPKMAQKKETSS